VEITKLIKPELLHLLGDDYTFNFIEAPQFNAQWDPNNFRSVVENALNDETVNILLGVGAMVTQEAAQLFSPVMFHHCHFRRRIIH
jgi:hypothetical protein